MRHAAEEPSQWNLEEKLRIVAESQEVGASVRAVAARNDVYPSLLHSWRRQVGEGRLTGSPVARFVPVRMMASLGGQQDLRPLELARRMPPAAQHRRKFGAFPLVQFHPVTYVHG